MDIFIDVNTKEKASEWFAEFESHSKTTMPKSRGYKITGNRVLFWELRHCIHSHEVKKKQGSHITKYPQSSRARDINYTASIHLRLERQNLLSSHSLEVNIKFIHNHVINSA